MDNFSNARLGMFTGSELHKLMTGGKKGETFGDTANGYILDKVTETLNLEPAPSVDVWAMRWGLENEADAMKWFTQVTGKQLEVFGATKYKFFDYNNFSGASPDALVIGESANVQVKCPANSVNHTKWLVQLPENRLEYLKKKHSDYYVQCQFEMMCCKTELCYFVLFDPRRDEARYKMVIVEVPKDVEMCADIDNRLTDTNNIKKGYLSALEAIKVIDVLTPNEVGNKELAALELQWEADRKNNVHPQN